MDPFSKSDPFRKKNSVNMNATVMVRTKDGAVTAHHKISNPWTYIKAMQKHPNVDSAWIQDT